MKKILLSMLVAMVALTSCQNEDLSSSGDGREVAVSIAASLPTTMTRSSDQGGIDNVNWSEVSLRYTLEIYEGETILPASKVNAATQRVLYKESLAEARTVSFDGIRLLSGKEYQFVIWADFVKKDHTELHYTTTNGLKAITVTSATRLGNDDSRDAYFSTKKIKVDKSLTQTISLKRPFGKLRVITTDVKSVHKVIDANTEATVTYATEMPTGFNAFDGTVSVTAATPATYTAKIEEWTAETATLAFDYMFVPATTGTAPVQVPVQFKVECLGATYEFNTDVVKLERNKLTTVKGNLLTRGVNIDVSIDDEFDTPSIDIEEVESIDEMQTRLNNKTDDGQPITIRAIQPVSESKAIEIPEAMVAATTPKIELEFGGGVAPGQTLTIQDESPSGTPYEGKVYVSVPASEEANVVINMPAATVYVNGKIKSLIVTVSPNTLVIAKNAEVETLTLNAGNVEIYGKVSNFGTIASNSKVFWAVGPGSVRPITSSVIKETIGKSTPNNGIILTEGSYPVNYLPQGSQDDANRFYMLIGRNPQNTADKTNRDGYTIEGRGDVTIYGGDDNNTGMWNGQNLVTVTANDVTIQNVKFVTNYNEYFKGANKIFELYGGATGLTLDGCSFLPNSKVPTMAGNVWFEGDATVKNCVFTYSGATVRPDRTVTFTNNTFNYGSGSWEDKDCISSRGTAIANGNVFRNTTNRYSITGNGKIIVDGTEYTNGLIGLQGLSWRTTANNSNFDLSVQIDRSKIDVDKMTYAKYSITETSTGVVSYCSTYNYGSSAATAYCTKQVEKSKAYWGDANEVWFDGWIKGSTTSFVNIGFMSNWDRSIFNYTPTSHPNPNSLFTYRVTVMTPDEVITCYTK